VAEARGILIHESQSLLMEMQACRSPEFVRFLAGELREAFGRAGFASCAFRSFPPAGRHLSLWGHVVEAG
jgi:Zn-dependent M32 family carboxypeptidase